MQVSRYIMTLWACYQSKTDAIFALTGDANERVHLLWAHGATGKVTLTWVA